MLNKLLVNKLDTVEESLRRNVGGLGDPTTAEAIAALFETALTGLDIPLADAQWARDGVDSKRVALDDESIRLCGRIVDAVWQGLLVASTIPENNLHEVPAAMTMVKILNFLWGNPYWPTDERRRAGHKLIEYTSGVTAAKIRAREIILDVANHKNYGYELNPADLYRQLEPATA